MEDKRFSHIAKDPKFRRIPKAQTKVKIDQRFQSMFTDKKFQVKYTTDKRGRPVKHQSKEDLKRYYELSSEEDSESSESESENSESGRLVRAKNSVKSSEDDSEEEVNEEVDGNTIDVDQKTDKKLTEHVKKKIRNLNIDYARGEQNLCSESSSDEEETDDEISESEDIEHKWGELDADADQTEAPSCRLAVCNLDWDRIRAIDLMVLFNSFLPPGGVIHSVAIYPSEFGKKRMKEEEIKGPIELVEAKPQDKSNDETEEGSDYHMEKLRQYQLNRLKYYYAVITFDNVNSADKVYTECDGMEYESSATKLDLRFIPDEMNFNDTPREKCDKLPDKYEPRFFTTTALQQAKVELTWDETNPDRLEMAQKLSSGKIEDLTEKDLQNYLAGSSSEEDNSDEEKSDVSDIEGSQSGNVIDKYKALLMDIQEKDEEKKNKDKGMEISWGIDLKEKTDKLVKDKLENSQEKTPFQKYLDKKKEKRKQKRELKKSKKQSNSEDSDIPSDVDMNDPYFAEEFNNSEFRKKSYKNKKSDLNEDIIDDTQKRAELDLLLMNEKETEEKKNILVLRKFKIKKAKAKVRRKKTRGKLAVNLMKTIFRLILRINDFLHYLQAITLTSIPQILILRKQRELKH